MRTYERMKLHTSLDCVIRTDIMKSYHLFRSKTIYEIPSLFISFWKQHNSRTNNRTLYLIKLQKDPFLLIYLINIKLAIHRKHTFNLLDRTNKRVIPRRCWGTILSILAKCIRSFHLSSWWIKPVIKNNWLDSQSPLYSKNNLIRCLFFTNKIISN